MKQKEINRSFIEVAKRFLAPMKKNLYITSRASVYYFLWALGTIYHVYFIQKLVYFIENHDKEHFINLIIIYAIFNIFFEIIYFLTRTWGWVYTVNGYRRKIHDEYLKKFIRLGNTETEKVGTGKLVSIIDKGMDIWSLLLDQLLLNGILVIVAFLFSLYTILKVKISYGIIFLIFYILIHILGSYINNFTIKERKERLENWNLYTKQVVKVIMSKFEILQTSKINNEIHKLDNICIELENCSYKMSKYVHIFFRIPEGFITLSKFLILLYLGLQILDGKASYSTFIGIFGVFTVLDSAISKSMTFYKDFTHNFTLVEKLWDFFDTTPEIQGYETGKEFNYKSGIIELKNISFGYNNEKKVLNNFSLNIQGGQITALVGNSGGGKTTLVKIISQFIRQDKGKLIIDGQDISKVSLKSYYKNIGYLTQEPSVFDGSIIDNLTYAIEVPLSQPFPPGEKGVEQKIDDIIKLSKCEFIYDFKDGLDTQIGERGVKLSGGQKQRLAIAKIMLKNPKIIILDEPTSALDSFSEELITKAMNNLFKGRTVIVIAHRLQTVKHADDIIVIENGLIAERGTHKELIAQKGIYNRMLELQSGF